MYHYATAELHTLTQAHTSHSSPDYRPAHHHGYCHLSHSPRWASVRSRRLPDASCTTQQTALTGKHSSISWTAPRQLPQSVRSLSHLTSPTLPVPAVPQVQGRAGHRQRGEAGCGQNVINGRRDNARVFSRAKELQVLRTPEKRTSTQQTTYASAGYAHPQGEPDAQQSCNQHQIEERICH